MTDLEVAIKYQLHFQLKLLPSSELVKCVIQLPVKLAQPNIQVSKSHFSGRLHMMNSMLVKCDYFFFIFFILAMDPKSIYVQQCRVCIWVNTYLGNVFQAILVEEGYCCNLLYHTSNTYPQAGSVNIAQRNPVESFLDLFKHQSLQFQSSTEAVCFNEISPSF